MKNYVIPFLLSGVLLQGCAPSTVGGVRALGEKRSYSFVTPENYQSVYRKVLRQERKCWETGLITAQILVQCDLYTDIKSGTISVSNHGGFGVDTYQVVDISDVDGKTKVVAHYSLGPVQKYGKILKDWVVDSSEDCSGSGG